ncbi:MAG: glycosyltransferase [Methylomarinum sp.]|nr:glycosyltransferase [Methylomarinum sp.]
MIVLDSQYSTTRKVTLTPPAMSNGETEKIHSMLFLPETPERIGQGGLRIEGYFKKNEINNPPLISVITIVYNGVKYIEQTINSVIGQSYNNVEYIIIDGGSTDGTLDIIKKYEKQIDYWVSESDKGISDAFNKGISLCTGEIIGIINADDWYETDVFEKISYNKQYDVIHGQLQYWKDNFKLELFMPNQVGLDKEMTLNHPTCFVKREVYNKIGDFNCELKISMDYDFLLRVYRHNMKFHYLPIVIANMRYCGVSDINWVSTYKEVFKVKVKNGINIYFSAPYFIYQIVRRCIRIFFGKVGLQFLVRLYRDKFSIMRKS